MPRELGPVVAQRELRETSTDRTLMVQIGKPRRGDRAWECPFRICGLGRTRVRVAYGVDAVQALVMAVEGTRVLIQKSGRSISFLADGDGGVPRYVPQWYGTQFAQRIGRMIDRELDKFDQSIAARRHRTG